MTKWTLVDFIQSLNLRTFNFIFFQLIALVYVILHFLFFFVIYSFSFVEFSIHNLNVFILHPFFLCFVMLFVKRCCTTMYDGKQCGIYFILGNYIALFLIVTTTPPPLPPTATINTYFMLTAKWIAIISDIHYRNPFNVILEHRILFCNIINSGKIQSIPSYMNIVFKDTTHMQQVLYFQYI